MTAHVAALRMLDRDANRARTTHSRAGGVRRYAPGMADFEAQIDALWEHRDDMTAVMSETEAAVCVRAAIDLLDRGEVRVAERIGDDVVVHQWLKQAILLLFRLTHMETTELGPFEYRDKIPLKQHYEAAGVRVVPGASARWGAYLAPGVIMMPSYVNIGAHVGADSMVDTWATVGSCAQIGERVHLAGGVGIGGVLEPPGAVPIMVGDDAFIGSRCMVVDGARVGNGAVLGRRPHPVGHDPGDRFRHRRGDLAGRHSRLERGRVGDASAVVPGR